MNEREKSQLVGAYLKRLQQELGDIPNDARRELLDDVREHIEEAWEASAQRDRTALEGILARLGEPQDLAQEHRARLGLPEPAQQRPGPLAIAAVVLTALFWPLGLLLAWISGCWRTRHKAIATAIPVLGLLLGLAVAFPSYTAYLHAPVVVHEAVVDAPAPAHEVPEASYEPAPRVGWLEAGGIILAAYAYLGAPLTAAVYLALQLRPRTQGLLALAPVAAVTLLVAALLVAGLVPMVSGAPRAGAPIEVTRAVEDVQ